jgi:hypothetical protein
LKLENMIGQKISLGVRFGHVTSETIGVLASVSDDSVAFENGDEPFTVSTSDADEVILLPVTDDAWSFPEFTLGGFQPGDVALGCYSNERISVRVAGLVFRADPERGVLELIRDESETYSYSPPPGFESKMYLVRRPMQSNHGLTPADLVRRLVAMMSSLPATVVENKI